MAVDVTSISSVYDTLTSKSKGTLSTLFDEHNISGTDKARVISSTLNTIMQLAVSSTQQQEMNDIQSTKATKENALRDIQIEIANATKQHKIDISEDEKDIKEVEKQLAENTRANKQSIVAQQLEKATNEAVYVADQSTALLAQVDDNRKVQSGKMVSDIIMGMGINDSGAVVSSEQWLMLEAMVHSIVKGIDISTSVGSANINSLGQLWLVGGRIYSNTCLGFDQTTLDASGVDVTDNILANTRKDGSACFEGDYYYFKVQCWAHDNGDGTYKYYHANESTSSADVLVNANELDGSPANIANRYIWYSGDKLLADENAKWTWYSRYGII